MATMASTIYGAVAADLVLQGLLTNDEPGSLMRFYSRGTLGRDGVPALPDTPYLMYGEGAAASVPATRDTSPATGTSSYVFYVYDRSSSFERIKEILREVRRVVEALDGVTTAEGMIVTEARWTSSGGDQYDPVSKNNVKTQTFRVVGKV